MSGTDTARRLGAETVGTGLLVTAVVGSGIMAEQLTDDTAVMLLVNALSTVAALGVLIALLGPVSGAHLNPVVTGLAAYRRALGPRDAGGYVAAQVVGATLGVALANVMFGLAAWELSSTDRGGVAQWLGEVVATAGLVWVVAALVRADRAVWAAVLVPAWIGAAYFFTSSTSFANPAVTWGRMFTDTFTGIAPASAPAFVAAQLVGAAVGAGLAAVLSPAQRSGGPPVPAGVTPGRRG